MEDRLLITDMDRITILTTNLVTILLTMLTTKPLRHLPCRSVRRLPHPRLPQTCPSLLSHWLWNCAGIVGCGLQATDRWKLPENPANRSQREQAVQHRPKGMVYFCSRPSAQPASACGACIPRWASGRSGEIHNCRHDYLDQDRLLEDRFMGSKNSDF